MSIVENDFDGRAMLPQFLPIAPQFPLTHLSPIRSVHAIFSRAESPPVLHTPTAFASPGPSLSPSRLGRGQTVLGLCQRLSPYYNLHRQIICAVISSKDPMVSTESYTATAFLASNLTGAPLTLR